MPVAGEVHVSVLFGCSSLKTEDNLTAVKAVPSDRILLETGTYVCMCVCVCVCIFVSCILASLLSLGLKYRTLLACL